MSYEKRFASEIAEMKRQDAAREARRVRMPGGANPTGKDVAARDAYFRKNFMAAIQYEFDMAAKWGAEATMHAGEVTIPIRFKYPPRTYGRFETWLRSFKNHFGAPFWQFEPRLRGFIFNEGGRGVTFTCTRMCRFRLYVAGWVLTIRGWKPSLRGPRPR